MIGLITIINCLLIISTSSSLAPKTARQKLHIGGVFAMSAGKGGWAGGQACLPAAQMAL
uniref:Uncharacterized protein n=1 Tax=Romanomermis culicivorax TaxID=13658 RepID=A0A915JPJ7_ROMCU